MSKRASNMETGRDVGGGEAVGKMYRMATGQEPLDRVPGHRAGGNPVGPIGVPGTPDGPSPVGPKSIVINGITYKGVPGITPDDSAWFAEVNAIPAKHIACWSLIAERIQRYTVPESLETIVCEQDVHDDLTRYFLMVGHVSDKALWGKLNAVHGHKVPAPGLGKEPLAALYEAHEIAKSIGCTREPSMLNDIGLTGPWRSAEDLQRVAILLGPGGPVQ